jgi:uncharacterized membrane protein YphA (DoxX/SURF4 family)
MSRSRNRWPVMLALPLRIYLGGVFLYAAWFKIARPYDFALSVATYQILPQTLVNLVALVLPWLELCLGLALILGFWIRPGGALASGLLVVFLAAVVAALARGLHLSCGCFASQEAASEISPATLLRDGGWLLGLLFVTFFDDGRYGLDRLARRTGRGGIVP